MNKSERRKALKHEDGADLISQLPDLILLLILSCLRSTQEVIRTSILSRRWRYLWTSIPSLDFNLDYRTRRLEDSQESNFKEFVYSFFLNRSVDLDRFRLSCDDYYSMSTVEWWIQATVMRNVKRLELSFCPKETSEDVVMPHCLLTCASLEVLQLYLKDRGLRLPNNIMGFPALRVLNLGYMELFDADSVESFLESCPMLEDLTLEQLNLEKIDFLCISSPKLKKLRFETRFHGCLKISCPNLMCLAITDYSALDIICEGLYSLEEAIISPKPKHICQLYPGISHLESLNSDLDFLYESLDGVAACRPVLPNLKTLELFSRRFYFKSKFLIKILKHCPQLESLCLRVDNERVYDTWGFNGQEEEGKLDEAETKKILTADVKWVESFKIKGEKMKLDVSRWKRKWWNIDATWGKAPKSHWMPRDYFDD